MWSAAERPHGWRRFVALVARPILAALGSDRAAGNDWNDWWSHQFEGYRFLPAQIGDYVELGCGPYTNTRLIVKGRNVRRIVCSDPLITSYLRFKHRWLAEAYRKGLIEVDDHPLENIPYPPASFDVVVMINVLDHVFDFDVCMRNAVELVRPGGFLLIGQDLSTDEEAQHEDVGHPIRVTADDVTGHLREFVPVVNKQLGRSEGRNPHYHYSTLIFAGRKSKSMSVSESAVPELH